MGERLLLTFFQHFQRDYVAMIRGTRLAVPSNFATRVVTKALHDVSNGSTELQRRMHVSVVSVKEWTE